MGVGVSVCVHVCGYGCGPEEHTEMLTELEHFSYEDRLKTVRAVQPTE